MVACGAFIMGGDAASLESGASVSAPGRAAVVAVRRLCVLRGDGGVADGVAELLAAFLLQAIERLAVSFAAKQTDQTAGLQVTALGWETSGGLTGGTPLGAKQLRDAGYVPTGRLPYSTGEFQAAQCCDTVICSPPPQF